MAASLSSRRGALGLAARSSRSAPRLTWTSMYSTSSSTGRVPDGPRRVALVLGSSRNPSNGAGLASWLKPLLHDRLNSATGPPSFVVDVIHSDTPPLPLGPIVDGNFTPSAIKDPTLYSSPAVRQWSALVSSTDLFVFLTPEYNRSYPGDLKNTLDHIYWEWRGKPAVILAYGGGGGSSAAAQLLSLLDGALRLRVASKSVEIRLPREYTGGSQKIPIDGPFPEFLEPYEGQVQEAIDEAKALLD